MGIQASWAVFKVEVKAQLPLANQALSLGIGEHVAQITGERRPTYRHIHKGPHRTPKKPTGPDIG